MKKFPFFNFCVQVLVLLIFINETISTPTREGWKWETQTGRPPKFGMLQGGRGSVHRVGASGSTWVQGAGTLPQIPTSRPRVKSADAGVPRRLTKAPRVRSAQDRLPTVASPADVKAPVVTKKSVHWDPGVVEPKTTVRPKRPRMARKISAIDPLDEPLTQATIDVLGS